MPARVEKGRDGRWEFAVTDPDGHVLKFVQPALKRATEIDLAGMPISRQLGHTGILVSNLDRALAFYREVLGFREIWRGGPTPDQLRWVKMQFPEGPEQIEFILIPVFPSPDKRGQQNHICLDVADVERAIGVLKTRPSHLLPSRPLQMNIGLDHKRQMNLYDPDGTRVELMEFATVDGLPAPSSTALPPK